jgi:hypothetical protein
MPDEKVREKITAFLEDNGYGDSRAYGCPNHFFGLPHHEARVRPEYTDIDGAHVICVSTTCVYSCTLAIPFNYNKWQVRKCKQYHSEEELLQVLEELVKIPKGIWAS